MIGKIHSIQSLGTVDGPGVRYVIFLKCCNLRCHCCHNPDTWFYDGAKEMKAEEIVASVKKYREYFGEKGGVTIDKITFPTRAVFHLSAGEELVLQREKSEAPNNMHEEVLAFASAIREGYVSPFWEESAEALRICDTLRHAAGIRFPSDTEDTSW